MTSYFPFTPSNRTAPNFMPTLDGQQYNCTVTWNLQAQRYYLNVFTLNGARVLSLAIVETDAALAVQSIAYDGLTGTAVMTTRVSHGLRVGSTVRRRVSGCAPADYAGTYLMLVTGPVTLVYAIPTIPVGPATAPGVVTSLADLVQGYFASTLIFRAGRFEVDP